jgi:hypothetical protein
MLTNLLGSAYTPRWKGPRCFGEHTSRREARGRHQGGAKVLLDGWQSQRYSEGGP